MEQLKVFIVEDEVPAQKLLEKWISQIPELLLSGTYADGFSALKAINAEKPDLIFLDIEMPKLTGIEMLELMDDPPYIIFTTAYQEYAVKAFELKAIDYLLKPFSFERFEQAIQKVLSSRNYSAIDLKKSFTELKTAQRRKMPIDRIVVKDGVDIFVIPIAEILFIEAQDDYIMIHTKDRKFLKLASLVSIEESLPTQEFVRVHRSYIVKVSAITKIGNYTKDSQQIILSNGTRIKVSRTGLALLREILSL